jgi:hypothetical protein
MAGIHKGPTFLLEVKGHTTATITTTTTTATIVTLSLDAM